VSIDLPPPPVKRVLEALERVHAAPRRSGGCWVARCPAHADGTPSLSISEGLDGRVLIKCHAGCATEAVLAALGLSYRDLFLRKGVKG
jgi:hypothetical protein